MRISWNKPLKVLEDMTPNEWLADWYPKSPDNHALADRLLSLLGLRGSVDNASMYERIKRQASTLGIEKSEAARRKGYELMGMKRSLPTPPAVPRFNDNPTRTADPIVISSDWHVPFYDHRMAERMMAICRAWKPKPIKNHIIGGDFVDFTQMSTFVEEKNGIARTTEDDLQAAEHLLAAMALWFNDILVLRGNHETRLYSRKLDQEIGYERAMRVIAFIPEKVEFSRYTWCVLNSEWRITHPRSYRQVPGSLARRLAEKHQMNIIMAHGHNMSLSQDVSGSFTCVDSGGMFDPQRIDYHMLHDTSHAQWRTGFLIVSNGKLHIFNNLWTDWKHYEDWLGIKL